MNNLKHAVLIRVNRFNVLTVGFSQWYLLWLSVRGHGSISRELTYQDYTRGERRQTHTTKNYRRKKVKDVGELIKKLEENKRSYCLLSRVRM